MRRLERALALLALWTTIGPAALIAQRASAPAGSPDSGGAVAIGQDTAAIDLAHLDTPARIERRLRQGFDSTKVGGVTVKNSVKLSVRNGTIHHGSFTVDSGRTVADNVLVVHGNADIRGALTGNLVVLDGNATVHPGGTVSGDVLVLNGKVQSDEGRIGGTAQAFGEWQKRSPSFRQSSAGSVTCRLVALAGTLLVLLVVGLGFVVFARAKFLVVADTVTHSFGRSFLVGFIGQSMILPTFGVLVVGLVLSVVGILLLPFVIVAYIVLVIAGLAGGYAVMAYVVGRRYQRQRLPADAPVPPDSFRTMAIGLGILATPWLARALLGWVPFAGAVLWALAFFATWILVTAGFGAMLLSRGGTRVHFAGDTQ